jgi:Flp pilus assembly protein protease CpaA
MMNLTPVIDLAAVLVTVLFFLVGSMLDIKTREVDDYVWLAFGALGAVLTTIRLLLDPTRLILTAISAAIAFLIAMGLFYFGLTGGADAKAVICLGLTLPLPPTSWQVLIGFVHPFFPVVVVMMGFICSGLLAVWFGVRNLATYIRLGSRMFQGLEHESKFKKALAFVSGYPSRIANLKSKFYLYPIEEVTRTGPRRPAKRHFKFMVDIETDRDHLVSKFVEIASSSGVRGFVWVTPGLPMLFFILIGLIIALVVGDPIFTTILRSALH